MAENYTTIKLPVKFVEELIDPLVADQASGYSSRAEIIKQAVRDFIEKKKVTAQERHLEVPTSA